MIFFLREGELLGFYFSWCQEHFAQNQKPVLTVVQFKKYGKVNYKESLGSPHPLNILNVNLNFINSKCLIYSCCRMNSFYTTSSHLRNYLFIKHSPTSFVKCSLVVKSSPECDTLSYSPRLLTLYSCITFF